MNDDKDRANVDDAHEAKVYEVPSITWREPYQPLTFGISCAKQPGNPVCNAGPISS